MTNKLQKRWFVSMNTLKNKIGVTVRNDDFDDNTKNLIASLVVLDTMQVKKHQIETMSNEKEKALCDKVKDRLIQSLLSYNEMQKLREDAYNQGYNAGFRDAMVELDPNVKPLNRRGYIA